MNFIRAHGVYVAFWALWSLAAGVFIHWQVGRIVNALPNKPLPSWWPT